MENAVDALKMAAAILVFIIAIGSSFSLFGTAKQTADSIITMRDKQAYLDAAELDNGILYTSTEAITSGAITGININTNGHRLVKVDDVISTILRYNKEKYGVTILESDGNVIARFDSNTENVIRQWNNIESGLDLFINKLNNNIKTDYATPNFTKEKLKEIYAIEVEGNSQIECGAPWYGNDEEIQRRIAYELSGKEYEYNKQKFQRDRGLFEILDNATEIIEVTNEIDQSTYLEDKDDEGNPIDTNLLQQYEMPTVEIVYIIQ